MTSGEGRKRSRLEGGGGNWASVSTGEAKRMSRLRYEETEWQFFAVHHLPDKLDHRGQSPFGYSSCSRSWFQRASSRRIQRRERKAEYRVATTTATTEARLAAWRGTDEFKHGEETVLWKLWSRSGRRRREGESVLLFLRKEGSSQHCRTARREEGRRFALDHVSHALIAFDNSVSMSFSLMFDFSSSYVCPSTAPLSFFESRTASMRRRVEMLMMRGMKVSKRRRSPALA